MKCCKDCNFWFGRMDGDGDISNGKCKRFPPQQFFDGRYSRVDFPETRTSEWCGEWKDRSLA